MCEPNIFDHFSVVCHNIRSFLVYLVSSYSYEIGKLPQRLFPFEKSFGARNFHFVTFCSRFFVRCFFSLLLNNALRKVALSFVIDVEFRVYLIGFNHGSRYHVKEMASAQGVSNATTK